MEKLKVKCMYGFLCTDDSGNEGIVAAKIPGLGYVPLVGADMARVQSYQIHAQAAANMHNRPVTLARFAVRSELEVIYPLGGNPCKDATQTS